MTERPVPPPAGIPFAAGDLALDFINTLRADSGSPLETLHTDRDVLLWMKKRSLGPPASCTPRPPGALLENARALRRLALALVESKKAGESIGFATLNAYLSQSVSHLKLSLRHGVLHLRREYRADSPEQFLAPLAEAIAHFLAHADFHLIRRCQAAGCVLWFTVRPSGRPRRFCAEETCGTRARVAAYRARQAQSGHEGPAKVEGTPKAEGPAKAQR